MENSFKNLIDGAESVLILLPKNPYFDQVAGALSLYLALENRKSVTIASSSPVTVEFNRLVGVDKITQEVGNKNLVIKFKNYQAQNIERVTYDIEDNEFRLSVIPKPAMVPPTKDQLEVNYSGVAADIVLLIGGGNESHFPLLSKPELAGVKKAHLGLSQLASTNRDILSFAKTSSSTAELVYDYVKELGLELNADIASNLLAGLHEGSKNFSSNYVTANTFSVASALMQLGGVYTPNEKLQKTYTARDFGQKSEAPKKTETPKVEIPKPESPIAQLDDVDNEEEEIKTEEPIKEPEQVPVQVEEPQLEPAEEETVDAPKSWLEPKIYKGTSGN